MAANGKVVYGRNGAKEWYVDGRQVTKAEFDAAFPPKPDFGGSAPAGPALTGWPLHSDALGYHPSQRAEAGAHLAKLGVPTEIDPQGRPVLRNREHRRQVLKALKIHDRNSFTGY